MEFFEPPVKSSPMATYRAHLERGEFGYQYSAAAGKAVFYPRLVCPYTGGRTLEWRVGAGKGEIHSYTIVYPKDSPAYAVVLVDMDEGYRIMSRIDGPADQVCIGRRVLGFIQKPSGDEPEPYPLFKYEEPGQ